MNASHRTGLVWQKAKPNFDCGAVLRGRSGIGSLVSEMRPARRNSLIRFLWPEVVERMGVDHLALVDELSAEFVRRQTVQRALVGERLGDGDSAGVSQDHPDRFDADG